MRLNRHPNQPSHVEIIDQSSPTQVDVRRGLGSRLGGGMVRAALTRWPEATQAILSDARAVSDALIAPPGLTGIADIDEAQSRQAARHAAGEGDIAVTDMSTTPQIIEVSHPGSPTPLDS